MAPVDRPAQLVIDQRFELEREHRRGGMGTVWRARERGTGAPLAIKLLHDTSAEQAARFVRESALLADLAHDSIVRYIAHGTTRDGTPYLAMEWLEGETLAERLQRGPLKLLESIELIRGSLRGLSLAHRRGIVHRDLKPSNLFLRGGALEDIVLLDLGLARHAGAARDVTQTGSIIGTPSYMAPEQAEGRTEPTPAVDVFSLGCVLFECLTGAPPFVGAHVVSVLAKVLFEPAPRLRALRSELPAELDALVDAMLAKDPALRPRDAMALSAELERLGALPDLASPSRSQPPQRPSFGEQELVSVILATPQLPSWSGATDTVSAADAELELPDVAAYGADIRRIADGTLVVALRQRSGAATDLAARAARCALGLQRAGRDLRFVIATGPGALGEGSYAGDVVERASIMLRAHEQESASAIWLDEVTAGLLDARFLTERSDSGIVAFVLKGEDPSADSGRRLLGRPTTCVGRDHELGMLELSLRACIGESSARAVLVVGPPGIGKSRLRHELLRQLAIRRDEHTLLMGYGDPVRAKGTTSLLGNALLRFCEVRSDLGEGEQHTAFTQRMTAQLGSEAQATVAFLCELVGLRGPRELLEALHDLRHPDNVLLELRAARQNPVLMTDRITRAWLTFLRAELARRPVVLVLDDLQWSDALTIALIEAALREHAEQPLLVLALGRPETQELFPELWAPRLTTLPLRPLPPAAAKRLIRQVLGDAAEESVERIAQRAGGNALYLEELIRAAEAKREAVPETVVAMLQARIGLLPAAARRVLRAASIFGESFARGGVERLLDESSSEPLAHDIDGSLGALVKHEILEPEGPAQSRDRFRFRHALMCDAAYGLMAADDLRAAHATAARYLEGVAEDPAVIADHDRRGGELARAVEHYTLAAERAWQRRDLGATLALADAGLACGAKDEARGLLRSFAALVHYHRYDFAGYWEPMTDALKLLPRAHARRLELLGTSTFVGIHVGKTDEVHANMAELLAIEPNEGEQVNYARTLGHGATLYAALGHRAEALRILSRVEQLDRGLGGRDPLLRASYAYHRVRYEQLFGDDPYAAYQLALVARANHEHSGDRRAMSVILAELGEGIRFLYSIHDAEALMRRSVELAQSIHDSEPATLVGSYLARLLGEHGTAEQLPEARALAEATIELCGRGATYAALAELALAHVERREGKYEVARALASKAYETARGLRMRAFFPHAYSSLLQVLIEAGDDAAAAALADDALAVLAEGPHGVFEMAVRLHAARALIGIGRRADAARGVRFALDELARRAAKISDASIRSRFATDVPEHVALHALGRELGVAG